MRHKPSSSSSTIDVNQAELDRPAVEFKDVAEYGPVSADVFPALANWVIVNNNRTSDKMALVIMVQEEVQYKLNGTNKSGIYAIDIISHYWKYNNRNLVVKVAGLHRLGDGIVEAEDMNIDYPVTIALYIIGIRIGVKSSQKLRFSVEANGWRKWAEKFANAKMGCISRLVRILGINSLEEIFVSQATLAMLWPLRFQLLLLVRLNKTDGKY